MITCKGVNRYFFKGEAREVHALRDIDLTIQSGEFTLLSGPSGCGKTTLLNAIGALDSIDSGSIVYDGTDITALSESEKTTLRLESMGFVFQAYNLVPVLSVRENIGFIMKLRGFEEDTIARRVKEVARMLEIEGKLDVLPGNLSGGQQQRVAVARAVAAKPKVILADEPTANLDSKNSEVLLEMMHTLNVQEKITILFASHDALIERSVGRVVQLFDGRIVT